MNPAQNRNRGKKTEQNIAKIIGGKRLGILGKDDVQTDAFSFEIKDRLKFSGTGFMEQAVRNCAENKTPAVIVHVTGTRHDDDLVMMRLKDWQDWHGNISTATE
ncbi:MAG: hypothetical protein KBA28_09705 [Syntrophaceae bacterium]|jgi:hypothetical protein|nr:hypothetical protein [Syntrophaceae bacterium]